MTARFTPRTALGAALALGLSAGMALAQASIVVSDAYVRSAPPTGPNAAAFMLIENPLDVPVHLTGVTSDVARKTELHTHIAGADGVMQMVHVDEGFTIPAHGALHLRRGAEHVMFMGLHQPLEQGATITITFQTEGLGDIAVPVVVDHAREDAAPAMDHGAMGHGAASGTMPGM